MLGVGLAFKLSAFPFHFWCPDVFEGAAAEVDAFLSVASKAAALALLVRVAVGFTTLPHNKRQVEPLPGGVASVAADSKSHVAVSRVRKATSKSAIHFAAFEAPAPEGRDPLAPVRSFIVLLVALIAAVTCTFGNLAAYGQTNIKRLMAYSTIAHAGYIMMPVAAAVALSGTSTVAAEAAYAAVPFYVGLYLFMNLGAFAIMAFLRNATGSEEIVDYGGLVRTSPGVVVCLGIIMFSLVGLPPLAGFAAKYVAFASVVRAMTQAPRFRGSHADAAGHWRFEYRPQLVLLSAGDQNDGDRSRTSRSAGEGIFAGIAAGRLHRFGHIAGAGFGSFLGSVLYVAFVGRNQFDVNLT